MRSQPAWAIAEGGGSRTAVVLSRIWVLVTCHSSRTTANSPRFFSRLALVSQRERTVADLADPTVAMVLMPFHALRARLPCTCGRLGFFPLRGRTSFRQRTTALSGLLSPGTAAAASG